MGINIGNNNVMQGNINIGDYAKQVAMNFNQEFNSIDKLLELLKHDIIKNYNDTDKDEVLGNYDELKNEISKPDEERNKSFIKEKLGKLNSAFSFLANTSSIAGLVVALIQTFK